MKQITFVAVALCAIVYSLIGAWAATIPTFPNFAQADTVETLLANKVCPDWYQAFWKGAEFYCTTAQPAYIPSPTPLLITPPSVIGTFSITGTVNTVTSLFVGTSSTPIFVITATGTIIDRGQVIGHDPELAKVLSDSFNVHP
jgi:hypothetical protein